MTGLTAMAFRPPGTGTGRHRSRDDRQQRKKLHAGPPLSAPLQAPVEIEQLFAWLPNFRRLTRWEHRLDNFPGCCIAHARSSC